MNESICASNFGGRTNFVIRCVKSTVTNIIHHGEIIEQGNHESLLAQNGYYAETYRRQLGLIKDAKGDE
ncbi:hypothetical protein WP50_23470 [Lactiplantibacillus plantarum]|nr:hypothetical protein WP50_23470 [Lactiplantibacillus plantarum]